MVDPSSVPDRFRFLVESVFALSNRGTAVIGEILQGEINVGDELRISRRPTARARVVHIDAAPRVRAASGERPQLGLVVPAFDGSDLAAGDELVAVD